MGKFFKSFFFNHNFVYAGLFCAFVFILGNVWRIFFTFGWIPTAFLGLALLYSIFQLFTGKTGFEVKRILPDVFSNGDDNEIVLNVRSKYGIPVSAEIIDEVPFFLQKRDFLIKSDFDSFETKDLTYTLRPVRRGVYAFHDVHVYVSVWPHIISRRFTTSSSDKAKVYPSFFFLRKQQLLSVRNKNLEFGTKAIRKIGQSREFENIREYVTGDDYRLINWKSTARKHTLMVNQFEDEQCQNIYMVIDKGRGMQHTFNQMALLDYAINSTLQLSHLALSHSDRAGLISFEKTVTTHVACERNSRQMNKIMDTLFSEVSSFAEADYSALSEYVSLNVKRRSMLLIYSTFDSVRSLQRQLPYIKQMSKTHLVIPVFFVDSDIEALANENPTEDSQVVVQVLAQNYLLEQKMIVAELRKAGILSILTSPLSLNANVINKYLEVKARRLL